MKDAQSKYVMKRVNEVERDKLARLKTKYTSPGKSSEAVLAAIRAGKIKVKKDARYHGKYTDAYEFFDLTEYDDKFNQSAYNKAERKVNNRANEIRDQIMLGGEEEALELLKEFMEKDDD